MFAFLWIFLVQPVYGRIIKIVTVSQLDFGTAAQGDPSKQVLPGTTDNAANASFLVTGDNNRAFTIALPVTAVNIQTGTGPTLDTIALSSFASFPSGSGALDAAGNRTLLVGATRAALRVNQRAGLYSGSYTITVVY